MKSFATWLVFLLIYCIIAGGFDYCWDLELALFDSGVKRILFFAYAIICGFVALTDHYSRDGGSDV